MEQNKRLPSSRKKTARRTAYQKQSGNDKRDSLLVKHWHTLARLTDRKQIVTVDRFFPSFQLCSACGAQWSGTKDLSVREWTCPVCGAFHDRDVNAAKNILQEGLRLLA